MSTKQLFDTIHCSFSHRTSVVSRVPFPVRIASRQPLPGNRLISFGIFSRPVTCAGSRWDKRPDFPVCLADKSWECLCISHVVQGQVSTDNLMRTGVHRQMQFSPDAALFLTLFFYLPLPFTEDF